ncbi:MAG: hypothetical protein SH848_19230 [Saprospiraceae bacterium]|nr:hypothetical protein [Saprospiraceae bacterium]MDZ4706069.1 hypothetical protein [Saprospiraceae bacterium]
MDNRSRPQASRLRQHGALRQWRVSGCLHINEFIVTQRKGIKRIIFEYLKLIAVIAVQAVFSRKPEKAVVVLADGRHKTLRQCLLDGNGFHEWRLSV